MSNLFGYIYLLLAIIMGITSNGFLKSTNGFTIIAPTVFCIISIIACIFCLSKAMNIIPVGFAYATYSGLTVTGVVLFAVLKLNQVPNLYGIVGIILIIISEISLSLLIVTNIFLLANLFALPIKFLIPYTSSIDLVIWNGFESCSRLTTNILLDISSKDFIISLT